MSYILFVYQEANFRVRAGLIPTKEFLSVRSADWELIQSSAQLFQGIPVLWEEIAWQDNCACVQQPWKAVIDTMQVALEWGEEAIGGEDQTWACKTITFQPRSFDHVKTFKQLAAQYKDQLFGGIAKLERHHRD